jgi:hypothetical protein
MPPRSYLLAAAALAVLVAVSLPLTLGFSIIVWHWLFAAAACILLVGGALRVVHGLRGPRWIAGALALPGLVWAANSFRMMSPEYSEIQFIISGTAAQLGVLAAAGGALRLAETMSRPHPAFRIGYALLAAYACVVSVDLVAQLRGWSFTSHPLYATSARALFLATAFLEYGAFVAAAVLVTARRDIEVWAGAIISLIALYMLYHTVQSILIVELRGDTVFWLQPVLMLVGGAALWRIGSVLNAQAVSERYARVPGVI